MRYTSHSGKTKIFASESLQDALSNNYRILCFYFICLDIHLYERVRFSIVGLVFCVYVIEN